MRRSGWLGCLCDRLRRQVSYIFVVQRVKKKGLCSSDIGDSRERSVFKVWKFIGTEVLYLFLMTAGTWFDIRTKQVPRWLLLTGSGIAAASRLWIQSEGLWIYVWGSLLGGVFLLLSKCTKESLGYADSWLIFNLGLYLGIWKLSVILCTAFLGAGMWAAVLLVRKKGRKESIPFIPFLTAGYLGVIGW